MMPSHRRSFALVAAAALLCSFSVAVEATFSTTMRSSNNRKVILGQQVADDKVLQFARMATGEDLNGCFKLEESNRGFRFKNSETTVGVSLDVCDDGRNCAKLFPCSLPHPNLCLSAFDCYDPADKKRCFRFKQCQCLQGSFKTQSVASGFTFVDQNLDELTNREEKLELKPVYLPLFKREFCFDSETFNLRACKPDEADCETFKTCRPQDGEDCLQLVPGIPVPE